MTYRGRGEGNGCWMGVGGRGTERGEEQSADRLVASIILSKILELTLPPDPMWSGLLGWGAYSSLCGYIILLLFTIIQN